MGKNITRLFFLLQIILFVSCKHQPLPNQEMITLLQTVQQFDCNHKNSYCPEATIRYCDSILDKSADATERWNAKQQKAKALLQLGEEQQSIDIYEALLSKVSLGDILKRQPIMKELALAYMRMGERKNCINNHSAESCIFPIAAGGIHQDKTGSEKAIEIYKQLLMEDRSDFESLWLMNIAYMTIGGYPQNVPPGMLIKTTDDDSMHLIKPFTDIAGNVGLNFKNMAGGSIVDDFNNDGLPDIVASSWGLSEHMHYCRNNGNGTFTDIADSSGLGYLTGGLNMMQTDYNNDGFKDIFVLRGAWKEKYGRDPNSLLRNNGDGTFTDVTKESGLLSFHPTQTATWADFNNDGWLDLFIGNETSEADVHPCELYINNKNGTFTEAASSAGCAITEFVKGVTSGDYDNDGRTDIFLSTLHGKKILLRNETLKNGAVKFKDVSEQAGFKNKGAGGFSTWFWDYDNDGWLDVLVCGYDSYQPLASYAAAEALHATVGPLGKVSLFRNKHNGTFEDVSLQAGLNKITFAMGANFGDIDNDGYLDFYLGTGNPDFKSLIPNKLFKNMNGTRFLDVTTSARVGNLQKGHGVSFVDLDNDGDQDMYIAMGGAFKGDAYENSLYLNPGQNNNNWINITLEGSVSNRAAIGAKIKVCFKDNQLPRSVYRDLNSGGSFGSNPLQQHIGIGQATAVDSVVITWPVTGNVQVFKNLAAGINIKIKEGKTAFTTQKFAKIDIGSVRSGLISCSPEAKK